LHYVEEWRGISEGNLEEKKENIELKEYFIKN
jgi:hypothetical protein